MENSFSELEYNVLAMELAEDSDPRFATLRKQLTVSRVANRNFTGVGFSTEIEVLDKASQLENCASFDFGSVFGTTRSLKNGVGFVVFVRNGFLAILEGYTFDELWPRDDAAFLLSNPKTGMEKTVRSTPAGYEGK